MSRIKAFDCITASEVNFDHKNKLFKNILKRIGRNIDPCGTRERRILNILQVLFIFTFRFFIFQESTEENHRIKTKVQFGYEEILRDTVKHFR